MKRSILTLISMVFLTVFLCGGLDFSDDIVAKIDFPFKAGGTAFSPGKYLIKTLPIGDLAIQNQETGKTVVCPYIARLAERDDMQGILIFDKVGEQYFLSEVYEPNTEGYVLRGAQGKHTHVKIHTTK